jgi:uncharacterized membrane protein YhdT
MLLLTALPFYRRKFYLNYILSSVVAYRFTVLPAKVLFELYFEFCCCLPPYRFTGESFI